MTRRLEKVSDLIMKELGSVIQNEISDPRIGFVTISGVKLSPDLSYANVFISVLGNEQDEQNTMVGLESSSSYLRNHLAKNMTTRTVPRLKFILDKGLDHSERIQKILMDLDDEPNQG